MCGLAHIAGLNGGCLQACVGCRAAVGRGMLVDANTPALAERPMGLVTVESSCPSWVATVAAATVPAATAVTAATAVMAATVTAVTTASDLVWGPLVDRRCAPTISVVRVRVLPQARTLLCVVPLLAWSARSVGRSITL